MPWLNSHCSGAEGVPVSLGGLTLLAQRAQIPPPLVWLAQKQVAPVAEGLTLLTLIGLLWGQGAPLLVRMDLHHQGPEGLCLRLLLLLVLRGLPPARWTLLLKSVGAVATARLNEQLVPPVGRLLLVVVMAVAAVPGLPRWGWGSAEVQVLRRCRPWSRPLSRLVQCL